VQAAAKDAVTLAHWRAVDVAQCALAAEAATGGVMLTATECLHKAKDLKHQAEAAASPRQREALMDMVRSWLELASFTDWQDGHHGDVLHRIRRQSPPSAHSIP
jgi:hypothetical protein